MTVPHPLADRVRAFAEEAVAGTDLYVVDVQVRGREGDRVLEVYLDSDGGADLEALAEASRRLGFLLETEDAIPGRYRLDVSSPGADRPLTQPRQFPRHVGRDLRVTYVSGAEVDGETVTVTGRLAGVTEDGLTLELPGQSDPTHVSFDHLRDARVVLPW